MVFARHVSQRVMELVETGQVTRKSIKVRLEYSRAPVLGRPLSCKCGPQPLPGVKLSYPQTSTFHFRNPSRGAMLSRRSDQCRCGETDLARF